MRAIRTSTSLSLYGSGLFWKFVNRGPRHRCWLWKLRLDSRGYGQFWIDGKRVLAHRFSFYLEHGRWPLLNVLHKCDVRACVNPNHLYEGTAYDNLHDAMSRGRWKPTRGGNHPKTHLTEQDVLRIRLAVKNGTPRTQLCMLYNLKPKTLSAILTRQNWRHI